MKKAEAYVSAILNDDAMKGYKYHRLDHTEDVVNECERLAEESLLGEDDTEMLLLAAWFHDTGYVRGTQEHEAQSEIIAKEFFEKLKYDPEKAEKVYQCIRETKLPQNPVSPLGKLLCDADMGGLGSESYWKKSKRLRKEKAKLEGTKYEDSVWVENEIAFLSNHSYFTPAGQKLYDEQKKANIAQLKELQLQKMEVPVPPSPVTPAGEQAASILKEKTKAYSRGVETMFRSGANTHINLSSMADNKANIMLSINALIISVTLSVLLPKLDSNVHLTIPTILLLATSLLAMIFATLSTRPKVTSGKFTREDIEHKRSNLLFFGNFYNMELKDYEWGMTEMMKDRDFLYSSLSRDLYFLGRVLAEKYRYLRICYTIFMYGLIITVISFGLALAIHDLKF